MSFGGALHYSLKDYCEPCKGTCGTKRLRAVNDNPIKFKPACYSYEEEIKIMHFMIHYARKFSDDSTFQLQNKYESRGDGQKYNREVKQNRVEVR